MSEPVKLKEKYGCVTSHWTPIVSEPAAAHPVYGVPIDMGYNVMANLSVALANAQLHGDDILQLEVNDFVSATLSSETLLSDLEVDSKLFGARYVNGELTNNKDDVCAAGAFDFIQKLRTKRGTVYRAVFLYHATPNLGDDNITGKQGNVSFQHNAVSYTVGADNTGDWRSKKDFDNQADAEAYLAAKRGEGGYYAVSIAHSGEGDSTPGVGTAYVAAGGNLEISFVEDPDTLLDNGTIVTSSISSHKYTISSIAANHDIIAVWAPAT